MFNTVLPADRGCVDARIEEVGLVRAGQDLGVAAILFTYRCTIACRHCCFNCRPSRPDVVMAVDDCVRFLADLHTLGRVVHIAGGEAMLYWERLAETVARAFSLGVHPHFIETNCSFATDDAVVRDRLGFLRAHGVRGLLVSADPYHQAFVPPAHFIRARTIAGEVFGPQNVWGGDVLDEAVCGYAAIARDAGRLAEHVRAGPPRLVGAAQAELDRFLDDCPLDEMPLDAGWGPLHRARDCRPEFDAGTIWEIHIDPYYNFQTNCGVILGKASETRVADLFSRGLAESNFAAGLLAREGPFGLARFAQERYGFQVPLRARRKCELCYTTRRFLRPYHPEMFGPAEIYDAV